MDFGAIFFITLGLIYFVGQAIGRYKLFEKANKPGWHAFVPIYGHITWLRLIGKPVWWAFLLLIPIVATLVIVAMKIDLARTFGKHKLGQHALALLVPFYFFPKIGFDPEVRYLGPADQQTDLPRKSGIREWGDAILFAGVAALIIRTFFMEAFMIPTSSMERSLMAGDFLFVSKFHYGARMPRVALAVPFVHNKIKLGNFVVPSYLDFFQLPYYRTPGLSEIERNDIVVFNFPAHDIQALTDGLGTVKAPSMKENYIKRCVGIPGDKLEVRDGRVYVNEEIGFMPPNGQNEYKVFFKPGSQFLNYEQGDRIVLGNKRTRQRYWSFPNMKEMGFRKLMTGSEPEFINGVRALTENGNWYIESTSPSYILNMG